MGGTTPFTILDPLITLIQCACVVTATNFNPIPIKLRHTNWTNNSNVPKYNIANGPYLKTHDSARSYKHCQFYNETQELVGP